MKVIGILGSPRKGGNSDILLERALEGARSRGAVTEKIVLNDLIFRPCQGCDGCKETGQCVIDDGMQTVYDKIQEADAVIIASPVYFGTISAQTKMMIDRFQCLWAKRFLPGNGLPKKARKGVFLCVSATRRRDFFENSRKIIKIFFATLGVEYSGEVFRGGVDKKEMIRPDAHALDEAYGLGAMLVKR